MAANAQPEGGSGRAAVSVPAATVNVAMQTAPAAPARSQAPPARRPARPGRLRCPHAETSEERVARGIVDAAGKARWEQAADNHSRCLRAIEQMCGGVLPMMSVVHSVRRLWSVSLAGSDDRSCSTDRQAALGSCIAMPVAQQVNSRFR